MRHGRATVRVGGPAGANIVAGAGVIALILLVGGCSQGPEPRPAGQTSSGGQSGTTTTSKGPATTTTTAREREVVQIGGKVDTFDRRDDSFSLHSAPGVTTWSSKVGRWGTLANQAYLFDSLGGRNLAVTAQAQPDGGVQVRVAKVVDGAGIVFRYRGPSDYWAVVAVPSYASWAVVKVTGGVEERVANVGPAPTADETSVAVRMSGARVDVILDDRLFETVTDPTLQEGKPYMAGLTAQSLPGVDPTLARFEDFRLAAPDDTGPPPSSPPRSLSTTTAAP